MINIAVDIDDLINVVIHGDCEVSDCVNDGINISFDHFGSAVTDGVELVTLGVQGIMNCFYGRTDDNADNDGVHDGDVDAVDAG